MVHYNHVVLDVSLRGLSFQYPKSDFALREISLTFSASTHTAIIGLPACGASTLLKLISGDLTPANGDVLIGTRNVTRGRRSARPLLYVTDAIDAPGRWSVRHLLVNAVRSRSLDRIDRHHELNLASSKWELDALLERRLDSLSDSERVRAHAARIELMKPAILVADRLLSPLAPSALRPVADTLYRTLRVMGATVISAPASIAELGFTDTVVVLEKGGVAQQGSAASIYTQPSSDAAARAAGDVSAIPVTVRGTTVESGIGNWEVVAPPFQGSGVALARPSDFHVAARGEESDLIFGIEEAAFIEGRWIAQGLVTGGLILRVELPRNERIQKGRVLPLRYDPAAFTLLPSPATPVPSEVLPRMSESR